MLFLHVSAFAAVVDPFEDAVRAGNVDAIKRAIEAGADANQDFVIKFGFAESLIAGERRRTTPPIVAAVESRNPEAVLVLIRAGAKVDAVTSEFGSTALIAAAVREDMSESVKALIEAGADVNAVDNKGIRALAWACDRGACASVRYLLHAGADPSVTFPSGGSIIGAAKGRRDYEYHVIPKIMEEWIAEREAQPPGVGCAVRGHTPLIDAIRGGTIGEVTRLAGTREALAAADSDGWTPLIWAASHWGSAERLRALLAAGADPNQATPEGWTPLMAAAASGHVEGVEALLGAGANIEAREGRDDLTPLMVAVDAAHPKVVSALLKAGADPNARTGKGRTAMDHLWGCHAEPGPTLQTMLEEAGAENTLPKDSRPKR